MKDYLYLLICLIGAVIATIVGIGLTYVISEFPDITAIIFMVLYIPAAAIGLSWLGERVNL